MDVHRPQHLLWSWIGTRCFRIVFFKGKHVNLSELESLLSHLRRVTREGVTAQASWDFWIRVWFGSRLRRAVELTKT